ncbi:O-antigen/teichoic acid export membrane protein [Bradyrhizobium sp. AZCC 2262]
MLNVINFLRSKLPMLRRFAGSAGSLAIGIVAQAIAFILLARYLGTVQFGHLVTVTAVTALANSWCGFGPGELLRRVVSRDRSMYPQAIGHTVLMILITGIVLSVLVVAGMMLFVPDGSDPLEYLLILSLLVPTNVIFPSYINMVENVFLARGDFKRANIVNGGSGLVRALAAVVACGFFGLSSLLSWALVWAAVHVVMCLLCVAAIWRFGRPRWRILQNEIWLGGNLALSSFFIGLRHNVDVLVLSAVTSPEFVGIYGAGRRVIGAALVVPGSFDRVIYGNLAVAGKDGAAASLKLARRYLIYSVAISGATSVALFLVAPFAPLIFGGAFGAASDVIRILAWTVITTAIQFLAFDALNASEHHKVSTIVGSIANAAGAAMVVVFGSVYGTFGIFVALYLSDITRGGALWFALHWLARRQHGETAQGTEA